MALGASRKEVLTMVVLQGLRLTIIGVAVGLGFSLIVTRLVSSALGNLLINVSPTDVLTFVVVPIVLTAAALGASYVPALRATRIDPMVALRYE
jgi:ABC-type antimicrobial peptide transport system permease subunit